MYQYSYSLVSIGKNSDDVFRPRSARMMLIDHYGRSSHQNGPPSLVFQEVCGCARDTLSAVQRKARGYYTPIPALAFMWNSHTTVFKTELRESKNVSMRIALLDRLLLHQQHPVRYSNGMRAYRYEMEHTTLLCTHKSNIPLASGRRWKLTSFQG